ncbi:MAG: hypothetical protein ACRC6T_17115 [Sarcina sp.]
MKSILKLIIGIVIAVLLVKFLIWAIIPIVIIGIGLWFYSKHKMKKIIKQYQEENEAGYKFNQGIQENTKSNEEKIDKEDNFNGTVIDVDFEDIKKD